MAISGIVFEKPSKCSSPTVCLIKGYGFSACNAVFIKPDGNRAANGANPGLLDLDINSWGLFVLNSLDNTACCRDG